MKPNTKSKTALEVVAAIIVKNGKILITQRPEGKKQENFWEFPGGKIEKDEPAKEALQRELKEELGIEIVVGELVAEVLHQYDWGKVNILAYLCQWTDGELQHLEVKDHCWVKPKELSYHNILAADAPIIEKLQQMDFS